MYIHQIVSYHNKLNLYLFTPWSFSIMTILATASLRGDALDVKVMDVSLIIETYLQLDGYSAFMLVFVCSYFGFFVDGIYTHSSQVFFEIHHH